MEENKKSRKEWIKTALIIFLVIMLILTFCSNTIMNLSVPEVSTSYIQSGTITEVIRGSGTVEASDPYKVLATEKRKIDSVLVKDGDHVDMDDTVFTLADEESEELLDLETKLSDAELKYYTTLLSGDMTGAVANKVNNSGTSSFQDYVSQITNYDNAIAAAEAAITVAQTKIYGDNAGTYQADWNSANATTDAEKIKIEYEKNKANNSAAYTKEIATYTEKMTALKNGDRSSIVTALNAFKTALKTAGKDVSDVPDADSDMSIDELRNMYSVLNAKTILADGEEDAAYSTNRTAVDNAVVAYYQTTTGSTDKTDTLASLQSKIDQATYNQSTNTTSSYTTDSDYIDALNRVQSAKDATASYTLALNGDKDALAKAEANLKTLQDERAQLIKNISGSYNAESAKEQLDALQEKYDKLEANAYDGKVTAPVSGTVTNLKLVAGESTTKDEEMFTIIPDGKGMTLTMSVTNEQAKKIKVGDMAELPWRYDGVTCMVKNITSDSDSNGTKQKVVFEIKDEEGLLTIGQNMSISVGGNSTQYDAIVPKSAVRTDNSGDYILVLKTKSSPLGNRYVASKIQVTKQASDDNSVAISGTGVNPYDYVITQSDKIVTDGQIVRLASGEGN